MRFLKGFDVDESLFIDSTTRLTAVNTRARQNSKKNVDGSPRHTSATSSLQSRRFSQIALVKCIDWDTAFMKFDVR